MAQVRNKVLHHKSATKSSSRKEPFLRSMPSVLRAAAKSSGSACEVYENLRHAELQPNYQLRNSKAITNARASMKKSGEITRSVRKKAGGQRPTSDRDDDDDDEDEDDDALMSVIEKLSDYGDDTAAQDDIGDNVKGDTFDLGSGAFDMGGAEAFSLDEAIGDALGSQNNCVSGEVDDFMSQFE